MSQMRTHFQRFLYPGLKVVVKEELEPKMQYTDLFNVQSSDSAFEETRTMAGLTLFVRTPENVEVAEDRMYDGFAKRYTHDDWQRAVGFSHQFMRDVKVAQAKDRARELGHSARTTMEEDHAQDFNNAFTSGLGPDGKYLCASDHPNIRGGSQSNIISPVSTVTVPGIRAMLTKARRMYDQTGVRRAVFQLERLVVPPEEEQAALEIIKSAGRPDTANRADNTLQNVLQVYVYIYLTDVNNWFGLARKGQHYLRSWTREPFHTREYEDEKARIVWMAGAYATSHGWDHYGGLIGSNPS